MLPDPSLLAAKYEILTLLGRGGMADVHLAVARGPATFSKLLVVKVLRPELAHDPDHVAMFLSEAKVGARMTHPSIVQVFDAGRDGDRLFIAMEYLDGQPLHRILMRLGEKGAIETAAYLKIIVELLAGLHHAHEIADYDGTPLRVVHRDVSPHNVFLTYDGRVKLVDFGIAKGMDSILETRAGVVKGKAAYMAPEQAAGAPVDRRADVYSVGVMLWEALAGVRLWRGMQDVAIVNHSARGDVPSPRVERPDVPGRLEAICMRALARDPSVRHPTAAALRDDLLAAVQQLALDVSLEGVGAVVGAAFAQERALLRERLSQAMGRARDGTSGDSTPRRGMAEPSAHRSTPLAFGTGTGTGVPPSGAVVTSTSDPLGGSNEAPTIPPPARSRQRRRAGAAVAVAAGLASVVGFAAWIGGIARGSASSPPGGAHPEGASAPEAPSTTGEPRKPMVELAGDLESDATLTNDKDYLLKFNVVVKPGVTLTIEKGTTLMGDVDTKAALVVQPRGRLIARGSPEAPIVFTSERPATDRRAGDWGGVILLGEAPVNLADERRMPRRGRVEGLTAGGDYGGTSEDDDSGVLEYVRIEYAGTELAPGNEINGWTLAGVGRRTVVDHVQVRDVTDDCFEFFGGTVDGKYLICQRPGDDGFDWDLGYRGRLQFLVVQQAPLAASGANGIEGDNDPNGTMNEPRSSPTLYNVTLCGRGAESTGEQYGVLVRHFTAGRVANAIVVGFDAGVDVRDRGTTVDLVGSTFFGNSAHAIGYPETGVSGPYADDDEGLDETRSFLQPERTNRVADPGIPGCFDLDRPRLVPANPATGALAPPDDGFFDARARFAGAVEGAPRDWTAEPWVAWGTR